MFYCWNVYACLLWIIWRRDVYFLNIYYIRVIYRFNRSRALRVLVTQKGLVIQKLERVWLLQHIGLIPRSGLLCVCLKLLCLVVFLDSLIFPDLWSADFKASWLPTLWYFMLERVFLCLLLVQGVVGTWILMPDTAASARLCQF